ncbi:MAG: hypothetical protein IJ816_00960 [Alloprevotella sp.]|nr:hypothetical protein [Alloprevotella sp.]
MFAYTQTYILLYSNSNAIQSDGARLRQSNGIVLDKHSRHHHLVNQPINHDTGYDGMV